MTENITRTKLDLFLHRFGKEQPPLEPIISAAQALIRLAEMEEEAVGYYQGLADCSDLPWVRAFAGRFAGEEMKHRQRFLERAALLNAENKGGDTDTPLPDEILQLMSHHITPNRKTAQKTAVYFSEQDAVQFAILAEENAIRLLTKLRQHIPAEQRDIIDQVLGEEMVHRSSLEEFEHKHFGKEPEQK